MEEREDESISNERRITRLETSFLGLATNLERIEKNLQKGVEDMEERLTSLEKFRYTVYGGGAVVLTILGWLINKLLDIGAAKFHP